MLLRFSLEWVSNVECPGIRSIQNGKNWESKAERIRVERAAQWLTHSFEAYMWTAH